MNPILYSYIRSLEKDCVQIITYGLHKNKNHR